MESDILKIIAIVGFASSTIAGLIAYFITFNEDSHHFAEKRDAVKHSLEAARVTFLFFVQSTLGIALIVVNFL